MLSNGVDIMKNLLTILGLGLLLTACNRHDAEFTKQIPGNWKQELRLRGATNTLTIFSDGGFFHVPDLRQTTKTHSPMPGLG